MEFPCKGCISFAICNGHIESLDCELLMEWYHSGYFKPKKLERLYKRKVKGWIPDYIFKKLEITFKKEVKNERTAKKSNKRKGSIFKRTS